MTTISMNYPSKALLRSVYVKVILPFDTIRGGLESAELFRTVYFLPGLTSSSEKISNMLNFAALASKYNIAVVIPDGENSFYIDQEDRRAFYSRYVADELVQATRRLFPLSHQRCDTFIAGVSMGGYGALMLGSKYHETFSKIAAISPAADIYAMVEQGVLGQSLIDSIFKSKESYYKEHDPYTLMLNAKAESRVCPKLYVCCGTEDRLTYKASRSLAERMQENGLPLIFSEGPGAHDSFYWNRILPDVFEFLTRDE